MRTTIQINNNDLKDIRDKNPDLMGELCTKIDLLDTGANIKSYLLGDDRKLLAVSIPLDKWVKINKWVIDNATEEKTYSLRDAVMTLLRG